MKKIFLMFFVLLFFTMLIEPIAILAQNFNPQIGIVPCGKAPDGSDACTIKDFFTMLAVVFDFIVKWIATPLAILMMTIGGLMILISAGNPNLAGTGKKILWVSVIGLVLVFCSWLIVNFILTTLGFRGGWNVL